MREEDRMIQMYIQDENCLDSCRPWNSDEDGKESIRKQEYNYRHTNQKFKEWKTACDREYRMINKDHF